MGALLLRLPADVPHVFVPEPSRCAAGCPEVWEAANVLSKAGPMVISQLDLAVIAVNQADISSKRNARGLL